MSDKQGWRLSLGLAGVGIFGAVLGSTVQYFYSLELEQSKAFEERQADAYTDLLNAFDKYRMSQEAQQAGRANEADELMKEYTLEAGAALRRISVFGDKKVVEAVAGWYRHHPLGPCDKGLAPELATWKAMRETLLGAEQEVSNSILAAVAGRCVID